MTPELVRPPQTPNSSTAVEGPQQRPAASRLPLQQAPAMSVTVPLPLQTPHASIAPAQHWPPASRVVLRPG